MKKFFIALFLFFAMLPYASAEILPSVVGKVIDAQYVDVSNSDVVQVKQDVKVKLLSSPYKNQTVELENVLTGNPYYDIKLKKGMKVILHAEENGNGIEFSIEDIKRSGTLAWLTILFSGMLIVIGRKKGLFSLISIAITVVLLMYVLPPMVLAGLSPVLTVLIISIISTLTTMYLVGGFNRKSSSAVIGTLLSLFFAGMISLLVVKTAHITGFTNESSMYLYSAYPQLDLISITIGAIILATLGAVMDVAMSIASTINEIYDLNNSLGVKELFISGMNVGKDIIGTMANTLILVYLGGIIPLILLAGSIDLQKFINLNQIVTELSSALIGSITMVVCIPITAFVTANLVRRKQQVEKIDFDCIQ